MRNALSRAVLDVPRRASTPLFTFFFSCTALHDTGTIAIAGYAKTEYRSYKRTVWVSQGLLFQRPFSTVYTSVHGERPSTEYAKLRKESLESEFGTVLGAYSSKTLFAYYRFGPFLALYRAATIFFQVAKLTVWHFFLQDIHGRAVKFRETLIRLGPFYVKLGQALSTRQDILPSAYCQELSKLQDQIPPFPTHVAIRSIESQLGAPINKIFADISTEPIASASLGQVYKAHLHSGELVAVKVQRPGMPLLLTLDALLFHMIGGQLKRFAKARKDLLRAVNEMVRHMFGEIDYILEAENADRFRSLYASNGKNDFHKRRAIKVPKIYWEFTRKAVLTMEWIDGIKLTDMYRVNEASLNKKELIDQGLYCSLRQLLEEGFFHADPHPGNLVATKDGSLAYFDFGMMGDIPRHYRVGLIQVGSTVSVVYMPSMSLAVLTIESAVITSFTNSLPTSFFAYVALIHFCSVGLLHWLVHFVNRDSLGLAHDFLSLGFLPDGTDMQPISDALQASFGNSTRQSNDFQSIMSQLYDVMYEFDFSLPPDYALVVRALGSLEGTAKALDPDFKVVESAYPFVIARLLSDPSVDMRKILRELLIRNDGSVRWNRLERLVAAISEQASESVGELSSSDKEKTSNIPDWKSFDMRAVVAATEDLLHFILSEKGRRVRVFLVRDIIKALDVFLQEEALPCNFYDQKEIRSAPGADSVSGRFFTGLSSLRLAVKSAPEVWTAMLIRMSLKPEVHHFILEILSALTAHSFRKIPETFWFSASKLLHDAESNCDRSHSS